MPASTQSPFICAECGTEMEEMQDVAVLQSLEGHVIYRCDGCGHILLVQGEQSVWRAGWLGPLFMELRPAISCVSVVR